MRVDTQVINDLRLTALAGQLVDELSASSEYHSSGMCGLTGFTLRASERKVLPRIEIAPLQLFLEAQNSGCRVAPVEGGLSMHAHATSPHYQELDRLGDEIAELSAHLDAATARLLDLIRE